MAAWRRSASSRYSGCRTSDRSISTVTWSPISAPVPAPMMKEIGFTAAEQANMKYPDFAYLAKETPALLDWWNKEFKA